MSPNLTKHQQQAPSEGFSPEPSKLGRTVRFGQGVPRICNKRSIARWQSHLCAGLQIRIRLVRIQSARPASSHAAIAQTVERLVEGQGVGSSILSGSTSSIQFPTNSLLN